MSRVLRLTPIRNAAASRLYTGFTDVTSVMVVVIGSPGGCGDDVAGPNTESYTERTLRAVHHCGESKRAYNGGKYDAEDRPSETCDTLT